MTEFQIVFTIGGGFGIVFGGGGALFAVWLFRPALFQRATQTVRYRTLALVAQSASRVARPLALHQPHVGRHRTIQPDRARAGNASGAGVPVALGGTR